MPQFDMEREAQAYKNSIDLHSHTMEANPINDRKLKITRNTINIVIVGKVGRGKSATGNSIIGSKVFETKRGYCSRVTCSSDLKRIICNDGHIINVIDTPGFDSFTSFELIREEIIKGINLAKDGIHVVLMVFSLRYCFLIEEESAIECMKSLFGDKIVDYMILVLTNGDFLESMQKSLKDFISLFPEPLRNIIQLFKNRVIVFDNTTKDMIKREEQVNELLSLIESVIVDNGEKPYSYKIFAELKMHTMEADPIIDWRLKTTNNIINVVIVGKVGNGKSATGNCILGREAFDSEYSLSAVTCSSELKKLMQKGGHTVNIIDTPGLFNFSTSAKEICGEIVKCISLAKDGIHAVLMVFSLRSQFSTEEVAAFESMKSLFEDKIVDYMIIIFTNGDILESTQKSLKDFISLSPEPLRSIVQMCKNRIIVFDNTSKDMIKREEQVNELFSLVEFVIVENGENSYSDKTFAEHKDEALFQRQKVKEGCSKEESSEESIKSYDDQQKRVIEIVKEMVEFCTGGFWEQLAKKQAAQLEAEERVARLEAERTVQESLKDEEIQKRDEQIQKLTEDLNVSRKQNAESETRNAKCDCAIL
ncbi:hypothetical protein KFK09_024465 [Dendrobium nobile]|uniref:AIG1-type G domain-containing protein n=1 Tax=Dendrobium nobile TaxID=94219 RepID=A0A8T3AE26_DENNO|nr:hypothetical protein KFK09_024465 [Dendrobium nobile]